MFDLAAGGRWFALARDHHGRYAEVGEVGVDGGFAVAAVGGHRAGRLAEQRGDPGDGRGQQRRVGRVALVHVVVEHDPVGVVGDLGLVAELHRFAQPALDDRAGVRVVQRHQPGRRCRGDTGQAGAGLGDDPAGPIQDLSNSATAATSRPAAASPWRCRCRRALTNTRRASATVVSVNSASSPVIANTLAFASSLRSFRCAEIDRPAAPPRAAGPALRTRRRPGGVDAGHQRHDQHDRAHQQPRVGRIRHVRRHHGGVGAHLVQLDRLLLGGLDQQRLVQRLDRLGPAAGGDLAQRGWVRHPRPERDPLVGMGESSYHLQPESSHHLQPRGSRPGTIEA